MRASPPNIDSAQRIDLPCACLTWVASAGKVRATAIAKATFELGAWSMRLASTQSPLRTSDAFWPGSPSVRAPSDVCPCKRGVDIVVVGHVHAPRGLPVRQLRARVKVGAWERAVDVCGDRARLPDHSVAALPFVRMPIVWERSGGGPGTSNPVGMPAALRRESDGLSMLPHFMPASGASMRSVDTLDTAGLGPIPATWPERRRHFRDPESLDWRKAIANGLLDPAFFNMSHSVRRLEGLGDPTRPISILVELDHLHPSEPFVSAPLPPLSLAARVGEGSDARVVALAPDALVFDADQGTLEVVYRGQLDVASVAERPLVAVYDVTPSTAPVTDRLDVPAAFRSTTEVIELAPATVAGSPPALEPQLTLPALDLGIDPLPFRPLEPSAPEPVAPLPHAPPFAPSTTFPEAPATMVSLSTTLRESGALGRLVSAVTETIGQRWVRERGMHVETSPAPPAGDDAPEALTEDAFHAPDEASEPEAPTTSSPAMKPPRAPAEFGAHRCGRVRWALDHGERAKISIFRSHEIDQEQWESIDEHYRKGVNDELRRGPSPMRTEIDAGYVEELEADLGEIDPQRYAELLARDERGVHTSRDLPKTSLTVLKRVIRHRNAASNAARETLAAALERARAELGPGAGKQGSACEELSRRS